MTASQRIVALVDAWECSFATVRHAAAVAADRPVTVVLQRSPAPYLVPMLGGYLPPPDEVVEVITYAGLLTALAGSPVTWRLRVIPAGTTVSPEGIALLVVARHREGRAARLLRRLAGAPTSAEAACPAGTPRVTVRCGPGCLRNPARP